MSEEAAQSAQQQIEQLAAKRAEERVLTLKWNIEVVIIAYAVLATVVLLRIEGVAIEIVALVATVGLSMIWLAGWIRGKKLYKQLYDQELHGLQEVSQDEEYETSRRLPLSLREPAPTQSPLSLRETEVLSHIASGHMNKQIAVELGISEQTIKNHVTHILQKMDVGDRTHAAVVAMQCGWVSPNGTINRINGKSGRSVPTQTLREHVSSPTMAH